MNSRITKTSVCIIAVLTAATLSFTKENSVNAWSAIKTNSARDSMASANAFLQVYKVLMSPRCMNCHPAGDVPLNGEDNHLHPQGVKRGVDGKGLYAMKCSNCHQTQNTPGLNMPPGAEGWHLPVADTPLVFQGKTAHELALQLKDTKQNGNKSPHDLIEHMKTDLVKWGWKPGEGRTTPPLSYTEFFNQFKLWIDKGAVVPPESKK
jgi:cytochrome c5